MGANENLAGKLLRNTFVKNRRALSEKKSIVTEFQFTLNEDLLAKLDVIYDVEMKERFTL